MFLLMCCSGRLILIWYAMDLLCVSYVHAPNVKKFMHDFLAGTFDVVTVVLEHQFGFSITRSISVNISNDFWRNLLVLCQTSQTLQNVFFRQSD